MKANNKTQPSEISVVEYIAGIPDVGHQRDAQALLELLKQSTKAGPVMWGTSIIGFGTHHYKYDSGREGGIAAVGFAVRKHALAVYGLRTEKNVPLIEQLGLAQESKSCVYIKDVSQIDAALFHEAVVNAYLERNN